VNLSVRAYNLPQARPGQLVDLMGFSYEDLLETRTFWLQCAADEVIEALERTAFSLPPEPHHSLSGRPASPSFTARNPCDI